MPVGESQQQVIGAAFKSIKPDLKRLCETHDLDTAWVDQSGDCGQLFGRVLDEFEQLLNAASSVRDDGERLQRLIRFSADAASLQEKASVEAVAERLEALERENRELRSAAAARGESPAPAADTARDERLTETFQTLASLTHKINNPLTSVIGRTQLMRMMGESPERMSKAIIVIEESARRVADYVRELALVVKESRERELEGRPSNRTGS